MGKGFGFPFRIEDGGVTAVEGLDSVRESLRNLILTQQVSLPGGRLFGSSIEDLVFENPDLARALMPTVVAQAFARGFQRGKLVGVTTKKDGPALRVIVQWRDTQTGATTGTEVSVGSGS